MKQRWVESEKTNSDFALSSRDVEAVEYFLLPLPALYKVSRFKACFLFHELLKCFLPQKLTASTTSASSFRFYIPAFASDSTKINGFHHFCFQLSLPYPCPIIFRFLKKSNASEFASASNRLHCFCFQLQSSFRFPHPCQVERVKNSDLKPVYSQAFISKSV